MPKQTKLDEHAAIYQPRQKLSERDKLKDMSYQDKLAYLWEYYKIHAAIGIASVALIVYIIYEIVTPNVETQFYAAIINTAVSQENLQEYSDAFADYLELDPETQSVFLNDQFYFSDAGEYASNVQMALATFIGASEVDVIIAPESVLQGYINQDAIAKLSEALPTDIYSALTDHFFISDTGENPDKYAYGIYLTDSNLFKDLTYNGEPYALGILVNSPHRENTVDFIRYLFKNN